ncbi:hypothetical protein DYI37_13365 [Fulvimarina endophytica]|uniref:Uncharacterized protein n=1 Tax=Fulvimarina endophytica TaxID=2293836 RepID=A0A371X142_9HYPH|nr:hypothetical protein [Fulvimarina endophytica]RFC62936.1 hypothetical protein DYI37_13365 [Fulvimarina endophytica]
MSRFKTTIPATVALMALATAGASAESVDYANARYGTSATFPAELFPDPLPEPTSGDGFGWSAPNGAQIFIYARQNEGAETPHSVISARSDMDDVTYEASGKRWAVVSGYRDDRIFYERYIFRGDLVHSVAILYPEDVRETYDPIVGDVTNSLRGPNSELD